MTEAEQKLIELVMAPDFIHALAAQNHPNAVPVLAARLKVAKERVPEGFTDELKAARKKLREAQAAVDALGRQHPNICYGPEGLFAKEDV
jgi:hypothetical protein